MSTDTTEPQADENDGPELDGAWATYSPEDNKLRLYCPYRIDTPTYNRLKAAGFKWAAKQAEAAGVATLMVAPRWEPGREDLLLELVEEIGDEDYSATERSADRADRFEGYRGKRLDEATGHADSFESGPSVFGHQNRARAERAARRHDRHRTHAYTQWSKAEYWQTRTAGVIAHALHRASPVVRRGRIKEIETLLRRYSLSPRWKAHLELRLTYERTMLAEEGGTAADVEMERGGWLGSHQIRKVNKSNVTGKVVSVTLRMPGDRWGNTREGFHDAAYNIERLPEGAYRPPTDEERAAFADKVKAEKSTRKATAPPKPPLINPTDEDAQLLQDAWNDAAAIAHRNAVKRGKAWGDYVPSTVCRMTQADYSARSKGTHSHCETVEVSEKLKARSRFLSQRGDAGRVTVFEVRKTSPCNGQWHAAARVIVLTDKPQKPIPWRAAEDARATMPSERTVTPTLPRLAELLCRHYSEFVSEEETKERERLLSDAVYIGFAWSDSGSQRNLTDDGRAALATLGYTIEWKPRESRYVVVCTTPEPIEEETSAEPEPTLEEHAEAFSLSAH